MSTWPATQALLTDLYQLTMAAVYHCHNTYKLVAYDSQPMAKYSPGKLTLGGAKQIYRQISPSGQWQGDTLGLRREAGLAGTPLLRAVIKKGYRCAPQEDLLTIRERFRTQYQSLPQGIKALSQPDMYTPVLSAKLSALQSKINH